MKSPAFQFYPKDWLSSRRVRMMTDQQRGWYIQLLCEAWESDIQGTLPNDPKLLWILAGASSEQVFNTCSSPVLDMFEKKGNMLFHNRLAEEFAKQQQMSEIRAKAGKESGKVRRQLLKNKHLERMNTCSTSVEQTTNTPSSIASATATAIAIATPYKKRLNVLFKRRDSTPWSSKEEKSLKDLQKRPEFESELLEIEKRYTSGDPYLRQDIQTLFNNWNGELDKARKVIPQTNGQPTKNSYSFDFLDKKKSFQP